MNPEHSLRFRIRHYECDAYGHLNNTTYLRYLDEVEIDAGLAGTGWGMAQADITYVSPLGFGDSVTVTARTRYNGADLVLRTYTFVADGHGEVARADAAWAATASLHSTRQEELALGDTDPVPEPAEPPSGVFVHRRRVHWQDVDESNTATPATLSAYAEDCGIAVCDAHGWSLERCSREGFWIVLRRHQILYGRPAGLGDELEITTWASDRTRVSAIRHYLLRAAGRHVARFRSHYVWVDNESMKPIRIPADFLSDFSANFSPAPAA